MTDTQDIYEQYWIDVTADVGGRARPAVPEEVPEGAIAEEWLLEIDGEVELVSYKELRDRVRFDDEYVEHTVEIPLKEITEAVNRDPRRVYQWAGDETLHGTAYIDPTTQIVHRLDFDLDDPEQNGVSVEALTEMGVQFE